MAKSARARSTCAAGALSERLRRVSSWRSSAVSGRRGSFRWRDMAHLGARGSPHHYTSSHGRRPTSAVLMSPIITLDASRLLFLGELVSRAVGSPVDGRRVAAGPEPRRDPERRSRAAAARLLAALNS